MVKRQQSDMVYKIGQSKLQIQRSQIAQNMKNSLALKRQKFHAQIRAQFLQNYMKKIRYEVLKTQQTHTVNDLIERTQTQISQEQFSKLIFWAQQKDQNNAIIHLGNLFIDGMVQIQWVIDNFQLRPKSSPYWPWLIKVIIFLNQEQASKSASNQKYKIWEQNCFQFVLNMLSTSLSPFCLEEALTIVKLLIDKYLPTQAETIFSTYKGALYCVKQNCLNIDKNISCLCYEIVDIIIEAGDEFTIHLIQLYGLGEVEHLMVLGLAKFDAGQKKFPRTACRTVNNIFSTGIMLGDSVLQTCVKVSYNEKNTDKTKLELSYMWRSFVENCPSKQLIEEYYDKVLHIIEHIFSGGMKKKDLLEKIRENFREVIKQLQARAHEYSDMVLMDVNYKANILLKHYIQSQEEEKAEDLCQPVHLSELQRQYAQIATQNSQKKNLNNSRNTTITDVEMDLEN